MKKTTYVLIVGIMLTLMIGLVSWVNANRNQPSNDVDLFQITGKPINDICIIEFDFIPQGPEIKFEYVFASEEYPNYVNSSFNDVFGFFLSGPGISGPYNGAKNIALLPNNTTPISINNVNCGYASGCPTVLPGAPNCSYYVNNCGGSTIQYDGFTTVLTAKSEVQCGLTYHIKLAIADVQDDILDSAVFFKEGSFSVPEINFGVDLVGAASACCGEKLTFSTPFKPADYPGALHEWFFNGNLIYSTTTSNVFVFENLTCTAGTLEVVVKPYPSQNCTFEESIFITYQYGPPLNTPSPLTLCSDDPATATGSFDLNMQINNIIPNFDSDYEDLGFYNTREDAFANTNAIPVGSWHNFTGVENQSVFLGVSNLILTGNICRSVMEFKLKFVNCDDVVCAPDPNSTVFDLTTRKPIILNGFDPAKYSISFLHDMPAAISGIAAISPENAYDPTTNPEEIYVRYWENAVPSNKQFTQFSLLANLSNNAGTDGVLNFCMTDTAVFSLFDYITGEQPSGSWSVVSGSGANLDLALGTITSNNTATNYVLEYKVNTSTSCPEDTSLLNVSIAAVCGAQTPPNLVLCDDSSNNGSELFDLSSQNPTVLGALSSTDYTITYHVSSADAISGALPITPDNAYPNTSNPQLIYIRVVKNSDNSAFDTSKFFQLQVKAQPVVTSFTGTATICSGSSTNLTFTGTPNAIVTYSDGVTTPNPTILLDGTTGIGIVSVSPTVNTTYSLVSIATSGTPVCTNPASGSVSITVNNPPIAGTDGNTLVCETSTATIDLFSLITGEQPGGVWTRTGTGTGGTFDPIAGTFIPAVGATTSTFAYTLTGVFPCGNDDSEVTVNIYAQPDAGADGNTLVCETSTATIDLFSLITGEQPGGVWTRTGTGTGGTFDGAAGTFIPAVGATTSTFAYTLTGVFPCVNDDSEVTVNIYAQPDAGTDGSTLVCETSTATIDLYSLITGEQPGGIWTRTGTGTGGTFDGTAGTFIPAVGATTSTFAYTLTGVFPCVNDDSEVTVNIYAQPDAGVDGNTLVCETSTATIDLYSLITGEQPGGVWTRTGTGTGGTFDGTAGTFIPAVGATTSTFAYTLTGVFPCVNDDSEVTVNIYAQPDAGTSATTTVCASSTSTIDLFGLIVGEQSGGVWTRTGGLGGTFDGTTGTFTPSSGTTNSTFTYELIGTFPCVNDTSVATVNFSAQPNAGTDGSIAICDNSTATIDLYSLITGEQAGGTWVRTSGTGGIFDPIAGTFTPAVGANTSKFTYTLLATSPCVSDSSEATVTISAIPTNVTISGSTTTCAGIPVDLTVTGTPGTLITWTGVPSSFVIGVSGSNVISVSPTLPLTSYTLTSASLNGCTIPVIGQSATVTVSATPQFITQIPDFSICNGGTLNIASQLTSTVPGTTFVWSATTSNVSTAVISGDETNIDQIVNLINTISDGTINIVVRPQVGICLGTSQDILVTVKPIPAITSTVADKTVICNNESVIITSISNPVATMYNWQINTATGVQIVGGVTSGTSASGIVNLQLALTNPLVAGTISFNFTPVNGICTGATIINAVTITVNPIPGTPIGLPIDEICSGETTNLTISSFPNIAGTTLEWTVIDSQNVTGFVNGTGIAPFTINDVLVNTSNVQGFVKYSVTSKLGNCAGGTTEYIVRVNPLPKPDLIDGHICVNESTGVTYQGYVLDAQLADPNFTYDWFMLNTVTNTYDALPSANGSTYEATQPGTYQVTVTNTVTNCKQTDQATVITVYPAIAFTSIVTEAFTNDATITITVNPVGTGSLIYSLDGGAWQNSNIFTGVEAGTHQITVEDTEGCTHLTETVEVIDYPKYFTPNGDGIHDYWKIVGLEAKHNAKIYIFDRYGKLIKQIDPLGDGWDGKYNGQNIPSTDYWFKVDYTENNQQKQFKAHFSLKR